MSVTVVRDLAALAEHAPAWDRLAVRAVPPLPYGRPGWVIPWLTHRLPPGAPWSAYFAYGAAGDLAGVLVTRGARVRRLTIDRHSPLASLLLAPEEAAARDAYAALLDALGRDVPRPLGVYVDGLAEDSTAARQVGAGHPGWRTRLTWARDLMARLPADGNEDALVAQLSRNARDKLQRGARQLAELGPVELVLREGIDAARATLAAFLPLEQAGWKGRRGTALGARPERIRFYADVVEHLAPSGGLLWHTLTVGPHTVAMEMLLRAGPMLVVHKATFDEAYAKASPGHVLWEQTLRWAARNPEIHEVELLTYDHMARRWGARPMALGRGLLCPRGAAPLLACWWPHRLRGAARAVRDVGRRLARRDPA